MRAKLATAAALAIAWPATALAHGLNNIDIHSFYLNPTLRRLVFAVLGTAAAILFLFNLSAWAEERVRAEASKEKAP